MYQKMYTTLFNAVTDALNMMDDRDYAAAPSSSSPSSSASTVVP